MTSNSDFYN